MCHDPGRKSKSWTGSRVSSVRGATPGAEVPIVDLLFDGTRVVGPLYAGNVPAGVRKWHIAQGHRRAHTPADARRHAIVPAAPGGRPCPLSQRSTARSTGATSSRRATEWSAG